MKEECKVFLKKNTLFLLVVIVLVFMTACGSSGGNENSVENEETTIEQSSDPAPIEPEPEPLPEPEPTINNGIGDLSRIVNACPSEAKTYNVNNVSCNLGNIIYFIVEGNVSNADSLIVSFYASATNDAQNNAVTRALIETNGEIFYDSQSATQEIFLAGLESVYDGFSEKYLNVEGYNVLVKSSPASDGGGGIVTYKITN